MKRIAILQRSDNRIDPKAVYPLFDTLSSLGCEICLPKSVYPVYSGHTGTMCGIGDDLSGENIDFIFVLGGDGSIISAARKNAALKIPIVGINFGKLGYLAELEVSELGLIEKIISGKCDIEERIMLDVSVIRGEEVLRTEYPALNDVVLSNGPVSKLLSFDLFANGVAGRSPCVLTESLYLRRPAPRHILCPPAVLFSIRAYAASLQLRYVLIRSDSVPWCSDVQQSSSSAI